MPASETRAQEIGTLADGRSFVRLSFEAEPVEIQVEEGQAPQQWVQVVPGGSFVEARDGRTFQVSDPFKVAANSDVPLLVDRDHESESWSGGTEAYGWGEELRVQKTDSGEFPRAGIWARVEWTPDGHELVKLKKYRYLSPVLIIDGESRDVLKIVSVALTNRPALVMQGLDAFRARFSAQFGPLRTEENQMKPETKKALFAALGLADGATDEQLLEAFAKKTTPAPVEAIALPDNSVSKEQFEALRGQVVALQNESTALKSENTALKARVDEAGQAAFALEVKAVLDAASADGKVTPGAREGYEKMCKDRDGLQLFQTQILPHLVSIAGPAPKSPELPVAPKQGDAFRAQLKAKGITDKEIDAAIALPSSGRPSGEQEV